VVVSTPEVAAAIVNLASTTLDNTGTHANTIFTLPANSTNTETYCNGDAYDEAHINYTLNQTPLAITVIDSSTAPPFDSSSLLHDSSGNKHKA
jgi:hypothetical protein